MHQNSKNYAQHVEREKQQNVENVRPLLSEDFILSCALQELLSYSMAMLCGSVTMMLHCV